MDLDAGQMSHALVGLQPNTEYVVTVAPLFRQVEGPTATVQQRTGRCWVQVMPSWREEGRKQGPALKALILAMCGDQRHGLGGWQQSGTRYPGPWGPSCRGRYRPDAADQHPGPHIHPGALDQCP